jgi:energy-coupling factor transporter ATP-binding protein EcfA2
MKRETSMSELVMSAGERRRMAKWRLTGLTIDGFRGFNSPVDLDFDASAVLLHGPNGSGKTSVFDALQWLLLGDIPRLHQWRLRKTDEFLTNAYAPHEHASVEGRFAVASGPVTAIRRGDRRRSVLEVQDHSGKHSGAAAEAALVGHLVSGDLPLDEVLYTSGLLQQDDLRQLLQTKPDARYRQLMRLLGLEALERFERVATARKGQAREATRAALRDLEESRQREAQAQDVLETSQLQAERATAVVDVSTRIRALLAHVADELQSPGSNLDPPAALTRIADESSALAQRVAAIARAWRDLPTSLPDVGPRNLDEAGMVLERAMEQARAASAAVEDAKASKVAADAAQSAIVRLAAAALPLLDPPDGQAPCPVCGTVISVADVSARLSARASGAAALAAAQRVIDSTEQVRREAEQEVALAEAQMRYVRTALAERDQVLQRFQRLVLELSVLGTEGALRLADVGYLRSPFEDLRSMDSAAYAHVIADTGPELLARLRRVHEAALFLETGCRDLFQQQASALVAAEQASALPRQRETLAKVRERRLQSEAAYEEARRAELFAASLAQSTMTGAGEILRERFAALEPLINDVYARLDPHASFTQLTMSVEPHRLRGTATAMVRDAEVNISMNPMLIFSSAQANIVVLSTFLALGWAAGDAGLPFVLLDDPLQALDDVNVLGFADLARHVRRERQLVLATHEQRFASLLERKLTGRREGEDLIVHRFAGWSRSGPEIETRRIRPVRDVGRVLAVA